MRHHIIRKGRETRSINSFQCTLRKAKVMATFVRSMALRELHVQSETLRAEGTISAPPYKSQACFL